MRRGSPDLRNFYPRPPRGGRRGMRRGSPDLRNFYPRPPRGGRRRQPVQWPRRFSISIHALREEGDLPLGRNETARKISIHALREEGDACTHPVFDVAIVFLSTPSARRATSGDNTQSLPICDFYPRPPRGGRQQHKPCQTQGRHDFYPRPPRGGRHHNFAYLSIGFYFYPRPPRGGRRCRAGEIQLFFKFLSTPSARRATFHVPPHRPRNKISIHALREEGDLWPTRRTGGTTNFYPRPPRGGRPIDPDNRAALKAFLSTPSARRATVWAATPKTARWNFYPRPPRGGRLRICFVNNFDHVISIHALREEGDSGCYTS